MNHEPRLDVIGAALGDPSRARILCALMDGRAFTNKELAFAARIAAPTATAHLQRLADLGLTVSERSGRHVYHRIASEDVADVLEHLSHVTPRDHLERLPQAGRAGGADVLAARCCYAHLAGRLGVAVCEAMQARAMVRVEGAQAVIALDLPDVLRGAAQAGKLCLDWTERRHHISGALGRDMIQAFFKAGWLSRQPDSRALQLTDVGRAGFAQTFGVEA